MSGNLGQVADAYAQRSLATVVIGCWRFLGLSGGSTSHLDVLPCLSGHSTSQNMKASASAFAILDQALVTRLEQYFSNTERVVAAFDARKIKQKGEATLRIVD